MSIRTSVSWTEANTIEEWDPTLTAIASQASGPEKEYANIYTHSQIITEIRTRDIPILKTSTFITYTALPTTGAQVLDSRVLYWSSDWPTLLRNFALKAILPQRILGMHLKGSNLLDGLKNTPPGSACYSAGMRFYSGSGKLSVFRGEGSQDGIPEHTKRNWSGNGR